MDAIPIKQYEKITGQTTIIHRVRVELGLSCDEYCVMDLIDRCRAKGVLFSYEIVHRKLGITNKDELNKLIASIQKKGFASFTGKFWEPSDAWYEKFKANPGEFEQFWKGETVNGRVIRWAGSKHDSFKKFLVARKSFSFEYLMTQRKYYFMLLGENPTRQILGAPVFLNMETQRFTEDWKSQLLPTTAKKADETKKTTLTSEDREKLYSNEV